METYLYPILLGASAHILVGILCWLSGFIHRIRWIIVIAVALGGFTFANVTLEDISSRLGSKETEPTPKFETDWLGNDVLPEPIPIPETAGTLDGIAPVTDDTVIHRTVTHEDGTVEDITPGPAFPTGGAEEGLGGGGGSSW